MTMSGKFLGQWWYENKFQAKNIKLDEIELCENRKLNDIFTFGKHEIGKWLNIFVKIVQKWKEIG